jgi:DNA polymerase V
MSSSPATNHMTTSGFPSPADDYEQTPLKIGAYLVPHPTTTFFMKMTGDAMSNAGIDDGDLLIVDRSLTPKNGDIIIANVDNEFIVRRLLIENKIGTLTSEPTPPSIPNIIPCHDHLNIFGVVTHVIRTLRK